VSSLSPHGTCWRIGGSENIDVEQVVIATGVPSAAVVTPPILGPLLSGRPQAPVAVIGLGSREPMHLPGGFGALAHPNEDFVSRGVLFESAYAPHRAPDGGGLIKVIAGGATHRDAMSWTDDYLVRVVGAEVASMVQQPVEAEWVKVVRRSIPQYNLGHQRWLETVDEVLETLPGLHLTGWGYRGVGLGQLASDALRVVAAVQDA
jgi:protoporphyrinogen oxidase